MFTSGIDHVLTNENKSTIAIRDIIKSYEHTCFNTSPNSPQHIAKPYLTSLGISFWQQEINTPQPWGSSFDCIWYLIDSTQGFPSDSVVKNLPVMQERQEMWVWSLGWEDPSEESMATHSSILAWRIPWTEEPGGLQSIGLQRIGQDWSDLACMHIDSTQVFSLRKMKNQGTSEITNRRKLMNVSSGFSTWGN